MKLKKQRKTLEQEGRIKKKRLEQEVLNNFLLIIFEYSLVFKPIRIDYILMKDSLKGALEELAKDQAKILARNNPEIKRVFRKL